MSFLSKNPFDALGGECFPCLNPINPYQPVGPVDTVPQTTGTTPPLPLRLQQDPPQRNPSSPNGTSLALDKGVPVVMVVPVDKVEGVTPLAGLPGRPTAAMGLERTGDRGIRVRYRRVGISKVWRMPVGLMGNVSVSSLSLYLLKALSATTKSDSATTYRQI